MLFSRDVQQLLELTRTQVLHWSKECLAEPPASPSGSTGHHQEFTPRNVLDLAITRELIDHGLTTRRIRNILAFCCCEPYHEEDQKGAIRCHAARFKGGT
jgi:DNA-binding transcriptional MerR regulator